LAIWVFMYFTARKPFLAPKIASNSLLTGLSVGSIIVLVVLFLAKIKPALFPGISFSLLMITSFLIPLKLILYHFQQIFLGLQKIFIYNIFELAERMSLALMVVAVLVVLKKGLFFLMFSILLITVALVFFFVIYTGKTIGLGSIDIKLLGKMLKYAFKAYISAFFAFLILRSDIFLVNFFKGAEETGIYSVAVNFADLMYLLPVTIGGILFPKVSAVDDKGSFVQKVSRVSVLIMTGVCIIVSFATKLLIPLLFGSAFAAAYQVLLYLLPGIFFLSLLVIYNNFLAGKGFPVIIVVSYIIGFIVNLILNLFLIPPYGAAGAAIASSLSYFLICVMILTFTLKFTNSSIQQFLLPKINDLIEMIKVFHCDKVRNLEVK